MRRRPHFQYKKMPSPRNYLVDAYNSLSRDINKMPGSTTLETQQGVVSPKLPEISADMPNEEILPVLAKYEKNWTESNVYAEWVKRGDENVNYWKGKHFQRPETDKTRALVDNVIFEAVEVALPQFISRNPEPDVELLRSELDAKGEPTNPVATVYVERLQDELADLGDDIKVRTKMKKIARHWMLDLVGIGKAGWDSKRNTPMLKVLRPRKIILDPDATVDEDGYTGDLVGEYRSLPAYKILPFCTEPGAEEAIKALVGEDMATKIQFIEWWSDTTLLWSLGGKQVLMKRRNPHWNWSEDESQDMDSDFTPVGIAPEGSPAMPQMPEAGEMPDRNAPGKPTLPMMSKATSGLDTGEAPDETEPPAETPTGDVEEPEDEDEGDESEEEIVPESRSRENHLPAPRKPYFFLVMFILGDQPVDNTSLITQNLANQDIINKRNKQIDKNADNMNNGLVVSLERSGLTAQQAKGVTEALRKGGVVGIPAGSPQDAVYRPDTPGLPSDVFNNLVDLRNRVKEIFGTKGSQPQQLEPGQAVRGQILNKTQDTDRIGGGISEIIEQFVDDFYNYSIQLKLVYEDYYVQLGSQGPLPKVRCSIKEGSLLPKDKVTLANQAIALAGTEKMSLLDLYRALDYPNAEELAVNAWLEKNAPDMLYKDDPRVGQAMQRAAQAAQAAEAAKHPPEQVKKPSISIAYKDLPPDGRAQAAAEAGIILHPEGIAAHEQAKEIPPGGSIIPPAQPNPQQ